MTNVFVSESIEIWFTGLLNPERLYSWSIRGMDNGKFHDGASKLWGASKLHESRTNIDGTKNLITRLLFIMITNIYNYLVWMDLSLKYPDISPVH